MNRRERRAVRFRAEPAMTALHKIAIGLPLFLVLGACGAASGVETPAVRPAVSSSTAPDGPAGPFAGGNRA